MKSEPSENKIAERSANNNQHGDHIVNSIKVENLDSTDNEDDEKISEPDSVSYKIGTEKSLAVTPISLNSTGNDNKYCHTCNIHFNYMSSYMAHKKSYCRNIPTDLDMDAVASNQAASVIATTRSSPSQTSVVT